MWKCEQVRRAAPRRRSCCHHHMSRAVEESNRRLLRARDAMDRPYAQPLDVRTLARIAQPAPRPFDVPEPAAQA